MNLHIYTSVTQSRSNLELKNSIYSSHHAIKLIIKSKNIVKIIFNCFLFIQSLQQVRAETYRTDLSYGRDGHALLQLISGGLYYIPSYQYRSMTMAHSILINDQGNIVVIEQGRPLNSWQQVVLETIDSNGNSISIKEVGSSYTSDYEIPSDRSYFFNDNTLLMPTQSDVASKYVSKFNPSLELDISWANQGKSLFTQRSTSGTYLNANSLSGNASFDASIACFLSDGSYLVEINRPERKIAKFSKNGELDLSFGSFGFIPVLSNASVEGISQLKSGRISIATNIGIYIYDEVGHPVSEFGVNGFWDKSLLNVATVGISEIIVKKVFEFDDLSIRVAAWGLSYGPGGSTYKLIFFDLTKNSSISSSRLNATIKYTGLDELSPQNMNLNFMDNGEFVVGSIDNVRFINILGQFSYTSNSSFQAWWYGPKAPGARNPSFQTISKGNSVYTIDNFSVKKILLPSDSDHDGIFDSIENVIGTNAKDSDSDNDGLNDWADNFGWNLDPNNYDTDGDGIDDKSDSLGIDSDKDGLLDIVENNTGIFVNNLQTGTNPNKSDSDEDGISDQIEITIHHTNPNKIDTDDDGFDDSFELSISFDPLNATSTPDARSRIQNAVEFEFDAAKNVSYRIEGSLNLVDWETVESEIIGNGGVINRLYSIKNIPKRYFRVRRN
jgi:hypothetical protein